MYAFVNRVCLCFALCSSLPSQALAAMPKAERDLNTLAPHLFGFVKDAFVTMQQDGIPQSVIITGESGSGKTATMKIALQYLIDTSKSVRAAQSGATGNKSKTPMSGGAWMLLHNPGASTCFVVFTWARPVSALPRLPAPLPASPTVPLACHAGGVTTWRCASWRYCVSSRAHCVVVQ